MRTLIQGGYVVGFDGREHEIIKDGVVVFDGNQIEYVGKQYPQPVDKRSKPKAVSSLPVSSTPIFIPVSMPATTFSTIQRRPIFLRRTIWLTAVQRAKGLMTPISKTLMSARDSH